MRRGLPLREYLFLSKWYEDYMVAKYWAPPPERDPDAEALANAPWGVDTIEGGST